MTDIKSLNIDQLVSTVVDIGEKKFRASQIYQAVHKNLVEDFDEITNLSKPLREKLKLNYKIGRIEIAKKLESNIDDTVKYLFKLEDGNIIESVFMKYKHGNSVCLSTQVGCRMACSFCASTKRGLVRNLETSEILSQIYAIKKDMNENITNIVLMGSGEPLDNFDNVVNFLNIINSKDGQNISYRNITLSTCGLADKIYELADLKIPVNLAISLHNPFDDERMEIMPVSKKYSIAEVVKACKYYFDMTGRRITFEYTLIDGINDSKSHAKKLAEICSDLNCHVNLIPLNEVREYGEKKSSKNSIEIFKETVKNLGVNATIRRELGSDIDAACGQLRIDYIEGNKTL